MGLRSTQNSWLLHAKGRSMFVRRVRETVRLFVVYFPLVQSFLLNKPATREFM